MSKYVKTSTPEPKAESEKVETKTKKTTKKKIRRNNHDEKNER